MARLAGNFIRHLSVFLHQGGFARTVAASIFLAAASPVALAQPGGSPGVGIGGMGGFGSGRMNVSSFPPDGPGGIKRSRQCLVLFNGTTFYGPITTLGLNYKVPHQNGELVIPFTQVRLIANSVEEAYAQQRQALKEPTVDQVFGLAKWCQEQGLAQESQQLCETVLNVQPGHAEARRLRAKTESLQERPGSSRPDGTIAGLTDVGTAGADPIVVNAAGITPETNAYFIRRIQPILINSCALGGCHSSDSQQEFRLSAYRLNDGPRYRSKENLSETLRRVLLTDPERSPLLLTGDTSEHHRGVMGGPGGEESHRHLKAWVLRVALEQNGMRQRNQIVPNQFLDGLPPQPAPVPSMPLSSAALRKR